MELVAKLMVVLLIVFPFIPLVGSCFFPNQYYKAQKAILGKLLPKSPDDISKLIAGGGIFFLGLWCVLYVFFSLVETLL